MKNVRKYWNDSQKNVMKWRAAAKCERDYYSCKSYSLEKEGQMNTLLNTFSVIFQHLSNTFQHFLKHIGSYVLKCS